MGVGRPSKYNQIFITKADEYLSTTGREQTELPTKEGFAEFIGVDDDTLDNWANEKDEKGNLIRPEFFGALKRIESRQKNQLVNDGLYGGKEVNPGMAIFLLKANHGLREKSDIDITSGGKPLPTPILPPKYVQNNDGDGQTSETH